MLADKRYETSHPLYTSFCKLVQTNDMFKINACVCECAKPSSGCHQNKHEQASKQESDKHAALVIFTFASTGTLLPHLKTVMLCFEKNTMATSRNNMTDWTFITVCLI